jgi:integrase
LDELLTKWLANDATITDQTRGVRETYVNRYVGFWPTLADVTEATATLYRDRRLSQVQAQTVRHELSALRQFLAWCQLHGHLLRAVHVPGVPTKATGTKHPQRRRVTAGTLSPEHVAAVLAALPDWSTSRRVEAFPIRARFLVGYETSLRPGALDKLSVPEHWQPGRKSIQVTADIDKIRWSREIPLSDAAAAALELVAPDGGLIFGSHDYREHIAAAAAGALPAHLAATFTGTHLRSARITHSLESPRANLPGVQFMAGQKQASTTARYVRPSLRAALEVVAAQNNQGRAAINGDGNK